MHVLADYGTTVESEIEVFAFIARANDDMRAFSLLAMVVSLFETGYLARGAGLFEAALGHLSAASTSPSASRTPCAAEPCPTTRATGRDSIDYLRIDWFALAPVAVEEVRARFCITPKSPAAIRAGSFGPRDAGGISPFQQDAGRAVAARDGRPYHSYGASLA